jgi:hypothetical protein
MTLHISFDAETEAKLRETADATGKCVENFVREAVEEKLGISTVSTGPLPQQQNDRWRAWVADMALLNKNHTGVVDDDRESIYAGRGE